MIPTLAENTFSYRLQKLALSWSCRGMNFIPGLFSRHYFLEAAEDILSRARATVLLTTGFYVNGKGETDGPPGTYFLARALTSLGYNCTIITDSYCQNYFDYDPRVAALYLSMGTRDCQLGQLDDLMNHLQPNIFIAVERCGREADGLYYNMRGKDITEFTFPVDELFISNRSSLTIGIGDGGNEIGMGNLCDYSELQRQLRLCKVKTKHLLVGTTSDWASYALIAALSALTGRQLLPVDSMVHSFLSHLLDCGAVDGISGLSTMSVDGHEWEKQVELLASLTELTKASILDFQPTTS